MFGKAAYLNRMTSRFRFKTVEYSKHLEGSTPPSIFVGRWGYPKVSVGPMLVSHTGDTSLIDTPERWIPEKQSIDDIMSFRFNLIRGQSVVGVKDLENKLVLQMHEIALSDAPVDTEAEFSKHPTGWRLSNEHQPFGPSAPLQRFTAASSNWQHNLENIYYDTDMKTADAVITSYQKGLLISQIQKAFSVGAMGTKARRRLVPTRWAITAIDDILCKYLLEQVKHNPTISEFRLYEHASLNNYFAILLLPTTWQYEWMEAFIHVLGNEELIFSDWEPNQGKKEYSSVGGCYYSCKFGIVEGLADNNIQAGAIVFREAYPSYIPLGVFNVRENIRLAMKQRFKTFGDLNSALDYIGMNLWIPIQRFVSSSTLLKKQMIS